MTARPVVNRDLLLKVKEKILAEPAQFEMEALFKDQSRFRLEIYSADLPREVPNCGTAACIAGWAIAVHLGENPNSAEKNWIRTKISLAELLGISHECTCGFEEEDCCRSWHGESQRFRALCYVFGWPEEKQAAWHAAQDLEGRAQIAAEVIDLRLAEWAAEDEKLSAEEAR